VVPPAVPNTDDGSQEIRGSAVERLQFLFPTLPSPGCRKSHPGSKVIMKW
jgi:hypothetical protein